MLSNATLNLLMTYYGFDAIFLTTADNDNNNNNNTKQILRRLRASASAALITIPPAMTVP